MSSERRLHPSSILFDLGVRLPRLLLPIIVLFFATQQSRQLLVFMLWAAGLITFMVVLTVATYLRFTYRYDAAELVIRSGILMRNERSIPYVRIQNLDAAQNPLHRLLSVVEVHVQTGGGAEPEASLRVLPVSALEEMRARVLAAGGRAGVTAEATAPIEEAWQPDAVASRDAVVSRDADASRDAHTAATRAQAAPTPTPRRTLLRLQPRELLLAGFIENRGMVLIFGALALLEQTGLLGRTMERLFEADRGSLAARWLGGTDMPIARGTFYAALALLGILVFIRLLSTAWAVIRLYDFHLSRVGDELHTEYGLFTRVSATIPLRRVQTVIVRENVLHRLFERRMVMVETAGGTAIEPGARVREPVAPILPVARLPALLEEIQPGLALHDIEWRPVHQRAFGRMLRGSLAWPIVIAGGAAYVVQAWAIAVFVVLLAAAFTHARLRARNLAWSLTGDSFLARDGAFTRDSRIARFSRVQVVALDRNPFDIRTGMATVRADTAGARGGVVVPYLPADTATVLHDQLAARTAETAFTW